MIKFTVDGNPGVKKRPKFARMGKFVKTYSPEENVSYENWVKLCYKNQIGEMTFKETEPLKISIAAFFQIPTSWSKKKTAQALTNEIKPTNSKDVDNIAKIILDALNGVAYADDHYITDLEVKKRYSDIPRVEIAMERVKP